MVEDPLLADPELYDEIAMYGELVAVAASSEGPLSQREIDRVLGVRPPADPAGTPSPTDPS